MGNGFVFQEGCLGCVLCLGFRVLGLGFGVSGSGVRVVGIYSLGTRSLG